jgi:hypothetical protein
MCTKLVGSVLLPVKEAMVKTVYVFAMFRINFILSHMGYANDR